MRGHRRPAVHPDDDLRHDLGRPLPAGGARLRLRDGGAALGDGAVRLDHRLSAARLRLRSDRPPQAGDRRRRASCCSACLAWILYGRAGRASRRTSSASSPASPPAPRCCRTPSSRKRTRRELSGTATGVVNFLNFTFSALLGPVFGWLLIARQRRRAARWRSSTTRRRSSRCSTASALAIVLTLLPEGNRTGGSRAPVAARREARHDSAQPEPESTNSCCERCRSLEPVPTAVAHPCEETALAGAIEAGAKGLITPILVGPAAKIREVAAAARHRPRHDARSSTRRTATRRRRRRSSWCARARPSC